MSSISIFLVIAVFIAIIALIYCFSNVAYFGIRMSEGAVTGREKMQTIHVHVMWVNRFLLSLLVAVLLVEAMVMNLGGRVGNPILFWIHFAIDVIALAILAGMRFYWKGTTHPVEHKKLAKFFYGVLAGVMLTGSILMYQVLKH
jgi:hypothetical protein